MAAIMQAVRNCPECGSALRSDAPGGLCPACLSRVTFGLGGAAEGSPGKARARPASSVPERLRTFGDFELLEEIGRGGMGVVYRARQRSLDRIVAVKMILAGHFAGGKDVQRFRAEAQAAAKLRHPNIVTVFEVGEHEGQPYFSMEYVEGQALSERVRVQPWPARRAAECLRTIAAAMHYAHEQGLVHRDLKPANILVDAADAPRITDFGLAKVRTRSTASHSDSSEATDAVERVPTDLTLSGQTLGSPSYMSPEQAAGQSALAGPLSDVYSLGAILYHLLTGRPPFQGESIQSILLQVQNAEPVPPRLLNPGVPRDLETICLKCLEKEPARRYDSADELAKELDRFLRDEPIRARPISAPERLWRWGRRRPAVTGLSAALLLLLVAVAIGSSRAAWRIATARDEAVSERDRAGKTVVRLELQNAEELFHRGEAATALAHLAHLLRREPTNPVVASWLITGLTQRQFPRPVGRPLAHKDILHEAVFSRDGRHVATASLDGTASVWDTATGDRIALFDDSAEDVRDVEFSADGGRLLVCSSRQARICRIADQTPVGNPFSTNVHAGRFSPDGRRVVTAEHSGNAFVWDSASSALLAGPFRHPSVVNSAEFSPDGERILTASDDGTARLWSITTGQVVGEPMRHSAEVLVATFSRDGRRIVTASRDDSAQIWDAATGRPLTPPLRHRDWVEDAQFSPDGRWVATASRDGTARVWDAATGQQATDALRHGSSVSTARFSPDSRHLVTASYDRTARVWDVPTGRPVGEAMLHRTRVHYAGFSPDGQHVVTCVGSGQIWNLAPALRSETRGQHSSIVTAVAFSPDGRRLVSGSQDNTARLWDALTDEPLGEPMLHRDYVYEAAFSADGAEVLTASRDGSARLWDGQSGVPRGSVFELGNPLDGARLSPDGKFAAGHTRNHKVWLRNRAAGGTIKEVYQHEGDVRDLAFSPDGSLFATVSVDRTARIWSVAKGALAAPPLRHASRIDSVDFSSDGDRLSTGCGDNTARLWDLVTFQPLGEPMRHNGHVRFVRFSPDGRRLVSCSRDETARVWDAFTGRPVTAPLEHEGPVTHAAFAPEGKRLVTTSADGRVRLWDVESGQLLSSPWEHGVLVGCVQFSPDGGRIAFGARDGVAKILETPHLPMPAPAWLPDLAEAIAAQRLNRLGNMEFVPAAALNKVRERVDALPAGDPLAAWARRFFER